MAHYDLYASLGVSRGNSCEQLRQEITRRLQTGQTTNPGGPDELRVALAVLGSPGRRAQYDAVLDNPNAAPLTPADITALANMPEQPAPQGYEAGPQGYQAGQSTAAGAQTQPTSKSKLILAAVIAVVVLVAAALGFFLLRDGSGDKPASAAETTTTSSDSGSADKSSESSSTSSSANKSGKSSSTSSSTNKSGKSSSPSSSTSSSKRTSARSSDPREMLDEFMALDSRNKRAKWIKKHTDFDLVKEFSDATDDDTNQVSLGNFAEIEAEAYADAVNENGTPRVRADYFLSEGDFSAKDAATMRQSFGSDITDAYMVDFRNSGGVIFVKSGGSWHFLIYYPE